MARISNIDDDLLEKAVHFAGHNGEAYAINMALKEFVENSEKGIKEAVAAFGTFDFDENWSPRKIRGKPEDGTWNP
jgi:Arc/MetJ family transcription regulator